MSDRSEDVMKAEAAYDRMEDLPAPGDVQGEDALLMERIEGPEGIVIVIESRDEDHQVITLEPPPGMSRERLLELKDELALCLVEEGCDPFTEGF